MMTRSSTRPIILALVLLAAAAPAHTTASDAPATFSLGSQQAPSKANSLSRFGKTADQTASLDSAATSERAEDDEEMEKSVGVPEDGGHKIRVRDAAPIRFWSGPRYGRSGRSGNRGSTETQAHGGGGSNGKSMGMTLSLRSSAPAIQPRHDRFFLGSRYGKRNQGEVWRGEEEEEEDEDQEEREERKRREEEAARILKEALRLKGLTGDSEDVFGVTSARASSSVPQPTSCIYTGIGNLYRCYEERREGEGVH